MKFKTKEIKSQMRITNILASVLAVLLLFGAVFASPQEPIDSTTVTANIAVVDAGHIPTSAIIDYTVASDSVVIGPASSVEAGYGDIPIINRESILAPRPAKPNIVRGLSIPYEVYHGKRSESPGGSRLHLALTRNDACPRRPPEIVRTM